MLGLSPLGDFPPWIEADLVATPTPAPSDLATVPMRWDVATLAPRCDVATAAERSDLATL